MSPDLKKCETQALKLSPQDRAALSIAFPMPFAAVSILTKSSYRPLCICIDTPTTGSIDCSFQTICWSQ